MNLLKIILLGVAVIVLAVGLGLLSRIVAGGLVDNPVAYALRPWSNMLAVAMVALIAFIGYVLTVLIVEDIGPKLRK